MFVRWATVKVYELRKFVWRSTDKVFYGSHAPAWEPILGCSAFSHRRSGLITFPRRERGNDQLIINDW